MLSREEFRDAVFSRDSHRCVVCGEQAKDAHHLIDRSLWTEENEYHGYIPENGASLCEKHHKAAERDTVSSAVL